MRSLVKFLPFLLILILSAWWIVPDSRLGSRFIPGKFREFNIQLPYGYALHGIDVSRYQLKIDWSKVREAHQGKNHIHFAFIKATQGINRTDSLFMYNWKSAHQYGIVRGAYHYFEPHADPALQAQKFIRTVKLLPGDLPPVLDVEERGTLNRKILQLKIKTWMDIVEAYYGVKPILYTSVRFYQDILENKFPEHPLWIAHYYKYQLPDELEWHFWQHSDKGRIKGIHGKVDFNVFKGTYEDFSALLVH